jgi:hypothetical protein
MSGRGVQVSRSATPFDRRAAEAAAAAVPRRRPPGRPRAAATRPPVAGCRGRPLSGHPAPPSRRASPEATTGDQVAPSRRGAEGEPRHSPSPLGESRLRRVEADRPERAPCRGRHRPPPREEWSGRLGGGTPGATDCRRSRSHAFLVELRPRARVVERRPPGGRRCHGPGRRRRYDGPGRRRWRGPGRGERPGGRDGGRRAGDGGRRGRRASGGPRLAGGGPRLAGGQPCRLAWLRGGEGDGKRAHVRDEGRRGLDSSLACRRRRLRRSHRRARGWRTASSHDGGSEQRHEEGRDGQPPDRAPVTDHEAH